MIELSGFVKTFDPRQMEVCVHMTRVGLLEDLNSVFDYFCHEDGSLILLWEPGCFYREIYKGSAIVYQDTGVSGRCDDAESWRDKLIGMIGREGSARSRGQFRFVGTQVTE